MPDDLYKLTVIASIMANVAHSRVFSSERSSHVCRVRFAVWHVLHASGHWPLHRIRNAAGYRNHGTILNGIRRAKRIAQKDPAFSRFLTALSNLEIP